jgi:ADP-L-glycero-D-manno-heptose 6-epimerase
MIIYFLENRDKNGLFNLGIGNSRTWNDLAGAIFSAMNKPAKIEYTDMPETLKDKYQYYTQANNAKLCAAGYTKPITSLEDGVKDYVENYLMNDKHLGTL